MLISLQSTCIALKYSILIKLLMYNSFISTSEWMLQQRNNNIESIETAAPTHPGGRLANDHALAFSYVFPS